MNLLILESLGRALAEGCCASQGPEGATESRTLDAHSNPEGISSASSFFGLWGRFGEKK